MTLTRGDNNPRTLTTPLDEQPPKVRRNRAKNRATMRVVNMNQANRSAYRLFYREELEKVGLDGRFNGR